MDKLTRTHELLSERATQGLDAADERELAALLGVQDAGHDHQEFDLAAATIELALLGELEEMPADVRRRLSNRGKVWADAERRRPRGA
jgi:predicted TPR repeat methyltransferase